MLQLPRQPECFRKMFPRALNLVRKYSLFCDGPKGARFFLERYSAAEAIQHLDG